MSTVRRVALVGIPFVAAIGLQAARQPGRDHPANPVQIRGLFRMLNRAGIAYEKVSGRLLFPLDPRPFEKQVAQLKEVEHQLYGSPNTSSEYVGLRAFFRSLGTQDALLSPLGRLLTMREIHNRLCHRGLVAAYVQSHPEVLDVPIYQPLIISGFPRSGSSFLQRLLATDPRARAPYLWEMRSDPAPHPPLEAEVVNMTDPRIEQVQKTFGSLNLISPDYWDVVNRYHETKATNIDEEVQLLRDCLWNNIGGTYGGNDKSYQEWILDESQDKTYMYQYLKVWLQVMSSTYMPASHWVLKTPTHAYFLPTLVREFPDANLVFAHRDPLSFAASACKLNLVAGAFRIDFRKLDHRRHGERVLHFLKIGADLILDFDKRNDEVAARALHVRYENLVADPIGTVEQIYEHFGYEMTERFREKMRDYLANNRQHKHGKPSYSLEEFGLNEELVQNTFAEYNKTFRA